MAPQHSLVMRFTQEPGRLEAHKSKTEFDKSQATIRCRQLRNARRHVGELLREPAVNDVGLATEDLGQAYVEDIKGPDAMAKMSRYLTSIQNSFYKALHELERLQSRRRDLPMSPAVVRRERRTKKKETLPKVSQQAA